MTRKYLLKFSGSSQIDHSGTSFSDCKLKRIHTFPDCYAQDVSHGNTIGGAD